MKPNPTDLTDLQWVRLGPLLRQPLSVAIQGGRTETREAMILAAMTHLFLRRLHINS